MCSWIVKYDVTRPTRTDVTPGPERTHINVPDIAVPSEPVNRTINVNHNKSIETTKRGVNTDLYNDAN